MEPMFTIFEVSLHVSPSSICGLIQVTMNVENGRGENKKFTCYFCNKTIENETEMGHNAMCGSVLEPCPNKCGSYIPRMALQKHNMECVNKSSANKPTRLKMDENLAKQLGHITQTPHNTTNSLGRNIETRHDYRFQEEVYRLSRKVSELEKKHSNFLNMSQNFQSPSQLNEIEILNNKLRQQNVDIEKLKYESKVTFKWKHQTDNLLGSMQQLLTSIQNGIRDKDSLLMEIHNKNSMLDKIQDQINHLKDLFFKEQAYNRQVDMNLDDNFNDMKSHIAQENAITLSILNELRDTTEILKKNMNKDKDTIEDHITKFTNIIFDLKAASHIASEATEKVEIMEREFVKTKKEINQIKLDMEILEGLSSSTEMHSIPGKLIWKITEVENKIMKAREFGSILKSPVFSTHEFGYRIRILLYLNGLKKWKDRYALMCIHVLKGEYDMLLRWPCHIESTITIRNLENPDKVKPLTKYVSAKRQAGGEESEEPQESSSSYIFIPHSILLKPNYVKNDTLFIEVNIQTKSKSETSL